MAQSNTFPSSGNVGIGTTSPGGKLEVLSDVDNGIASNLRLTNMGANAAGGAGTSISFNHKREDGSAENTARIVATSVADGTNVRSGKLQFIVRTGPGGSDVNAMMINTSGNVGIGTTSPTTKLHVVGDLTITGNIAAKYQDVAEWVESSQAPPLGTVVVLDSTKSNQVISSTRAPHRAARCRQPGESPRRIGGGQLDGCSAARCADQSCPYCGVADAAG